jgi:hypothetical protein
VILRRSYLRRQQRHAGVVSGACLIAPGHTRARCENASGLRAGGAIVGLGGRFAEEVCAMSAYAPIPAAPAGADGWSSLEPFLAASQVDAEWGAPPTLETLGRLTMLRADLESDIGWLVGLRDQLDRVITAATSARRDADDAR